MDSGGFDGTTLTLALTLCCCCLVVIGGGGGGFFLWRRSQKKPAGVIDVTARPAEAPRAPVTPAAPPAMSGQETLIYKRPAAEAPAPIFEAPKVEPVEPAKPAFELPRAGEDVPSASFTEAPTLRWPAPDLTITPPDEAVEATPAAAVEAAESTTADVVESAGAAAGGLFGLPSVEAPAIPAAPAIPTPSAEPQAAPEFTLPINDAPAAAPSLPDLPAAGDDSQRTMLHMPRPTIPDLPSAADPNQTIVATPRPSTGGRAPDIRARLLALNDADKPYEVSESGFRIMFAPKAITGYLLEIAFDFITGSARFTETGPVDDGRIKRDAREVLEGAGWTID